MARVNVPWLDDEAGMRLRRRAAVNQRSLEDEARHILEEAEGNDRELRTAAFQVASAGLRRKTAGRPQTPAEVLIRADRDFGHRF
ncbi:MAG: hypothetical protein OXI45_06400 [Acidobacteriota bacterium]|nr:hypothetical protein [Acidobacteriota bacterium]MXW72074.1 hypothetical protein [Acidobacteriota bacterium]MYE44851.1 hypothetical protein [Acidobacteriota bacterium]